MLRRKINRIVFIILICLTFTLESIAQNYDKPDGTLPVELTYFVGDVVDSSVELRWGTATEVNNYGYDILRTDTSFDWETIGFVQGHGNSNSPKDYLFIDSLIETSGKYFYLLKQIDTDGNYEFTEDTVKVIVDFVTDIIEDNISSNSINDMHFILFQNYPNPFNPETVISFELMEPKNIILNLYSSNGEFVESLRSGRMNSGSHFVKFNANHLSSGTYIYKLTVGNNSFSKKMLLIK